MENRQPESMKLEEDKLDVVSGGVNVPPLEERIRRVGGAFYARGYSREQVNEYLRNKYLMDPSLSKEDFYSLSAQMGEWVDQACADVDRARAEKEARRQAALAAEQEE